SGPRQWQTSRWCLWRSPRLHSESAWLPLSRPTPVPSRNFRQDAPPTATGNACDPMTDKPDGKRGWRLVLRTGAPGIRFVPSRVEGLPAVTEVGIFPDRLEVCTSGEWKLFPFAEIAQWPRPVLLRSE